MGQETAQSTPTPTYYQKSPGIINDIPAAVGALASRDILMRRSGVEWLGNFTSAYGMPDQIKANRAKLHGRSDLVAPLTRAVREMPTEDATQAVSILGYIGPSAASAIPAICDAIDNFPNDYSPNRGTMLGGLVDLADGPNKLVQAVAVYLRDPDSGNRVSAARGLRYCADPNYIRSNPAILDEYKAILTGDTRIWQQRVQADAVRALSTALVDPTKTVRITAAESTVDLTKRFNGDTVSTAWQPAVQPLTAMASSTDPAEQLAGLKALAYLPADISSAAEPLREALNSDDDQRAFALLAISHAAQANRLKVVEVFVSHLKVHGVTKRSTATEAVKLAVLALWDGTAPVSQTSGPFRDTLVSSYMEDMPPHTESPENIAKAHDILLAALVAAASDPVRPVKGFATDALVEIGKFVSSRRGTFPVSVTGHAIGENVWAKVTSAMQTAADAMKTTDPDLAKRLTDSFASLNSGIII